jgi:cation/acetate symporter
MYWLRFAVLLATGAAYAAGADLGQVDKQPTNWVWLFPCCYVCGGHLFITSRAASKQNQLLISTPAAAASQASSNGLAIAGDHKSAAPFLLLAAVMASGYDGSTPSVFAAGPSLPFDGRAIA